MSDLGAGNLVERLKDVGEQRLAFSVVLPALDGVGTTSDLPGVRRMLQAGDGVEDEGPKMSLGHQVRGEFAVEGLVCDERVLVEVGDLDLRRRDLEVGSRVHGNYYLRA